MSDGDGGVIASEERGKGRVDEGFRFGVEGRGGFVENQDVGILD